MPTASTISSSQTSRALPRQAVTDLVYDLGALKPSPLGLTNGLGITPRPVGTEQVDVQRHFGNDFGLVKISLTSRRGGQGQCAGNCVSPRCLFAAGSIGKATGNGAREPDKSAYVLSCSKHREHSVWCVWYTVFAHLILRIKSLSITLFFIELRSIY